MKKLITSTLFLFSLNVHAIECPESDKLDLNGFWDKSIEVFLGRVVSSKLIESSDPELIEITIKVKEVFKGNPKAEITTKSYESLSWAGTTVGMNSIYFSDGKNYIDVCSKILEINPGEIDLEELFVYTDRADITYAKDIEKVLKLSGKMP